METEATSASFIAVTSDRALTTVLAKGLAPLEHRLIDERVQRIQPILQQQLILGRELLKSRYRLC